MRIIAAEESQDVQIVDDEDLWEVMDRSECFVDAFLMSDLVFQIP